MTKYLLFICFFISCALCSSNVINLSYLNNDDCVTAAASLTFSSDCKVNATCIGNSIEITNVGVCNLGSMGNLLELSVDYLYRFNVQYSTPTTCSNSYDTKEGSSYCDYNNLCDPYGVFHAYSNSGAACYLSIVETDGMKEFIVMSP